MPVSGGTTRKLVERALAPAQELVALAVALELELGVAGERVGRAEHVGDDRMVDDQLGRDQRVDLAGIAAERRPWRRASPPGRRRAGTPVKSCIRTRAGANAISRLGLAAAVPVGERLDVVGGDVHAVLVAQEVLEQDLERVRQAPRRARPSRKISYDRSPTANRPLVPKLLALICLSLWSRPGASLADGTPV